MTTQNLGDLIRNAKPTDFTPVPEGNYDVTVESAEFTSSKAGNAMFKVTFVIDEGQECAGRKLWRNIAITEKSVGLAVDNLTTLGADQEAIAEAIETEDGADVCRQLIDSEATVQVKHREWDGRIQSDVKKILPRKGSAPRVASGESAGSKPNRPF